MELRTADTGNAPLNWVFPDVEVTPAMSTVPGFPGFKLCGALVVTVTMEDTSDTLLIPTEEETFVTSIPWTGPDPPGVTNARCPCGAMAICG